ncbi:hypothetical protein [Lacticaseibacillus porcinae]|uniref:hypothetical protein n=1 Tax=Lacticaseibacillus porcinae TaxID=1123687 RepID=UPI000F7A41B7|nr:hypothetical protein [Lacticaseibacillus porcinae]
MSKVITGTVIIAASLLTTACANQAKPSTHATEYTATEFHAKGQPVLRNSTDAQMRLWVDAKQQHAVTELRTSLMGANFYRYEAFTVEKKGKHLKLTSTGELLAESFKSRQALNAHKTPEGYTYNKPEKNSEVTTYTFTPKQAFEMKVTDPSYGKFERTDADAKFQPVANRLKFLKQAGVQEIKDGF